MNANKIEFIGNHTIENELDFFESVKNYLPPYLTQNPLSCDYQQALEAKIEEWVKIKKLIKREEALRKEIIAMCQNKDYTGFGVKVIKVTRKGNIEYGRIPQLKEMDLEQYRGDPIEYWKITNDE
jgi:hypothetical protein